MSVSQECLETRPKEPKHVCKFLRSLTRLEPTGRQLWTVCEGTGVGTGGRADSSPFWVVRTKESTTGVQVFFTNMPGDVLDRQATVIPRVSAMKR